MLRTVEWVKQLEQPNVWDQNAFNDLTRKGSGHSDPFGIFPAFMGKLKMGVLPVSIFASGQVFFVQASCALLFARITHARARMSTYSCKHAHTPTQRLLVRGVNDAQLAACLQFGWRSGSFILSCR